MFLLVFLEKYPLLPSVRFFRVPFGEVEGRGCPSIDYVLETHMWVRLVQYLGGMD